MLCVNEPTAVVVVAAAAAVRASIWDKLVDGATVFWLAFRLCLTRTLSLTLSLVEHERIAVFGII